MLTSAQLVRNYPNFEAWIAYELEKFRKCMAVQGDLPEGGSHEGLRRRLEYSCLVASNIMGWSAYR